MKLRILKVLSRPKAAIGVSLLDVISNALASIILLFFIFAALRGQPRPPERVLGMLIIDYKINIADTTEIKIYVKAPMIKGISPVLLDDSLIQTLRSEIVDTIKGVWDHAVILTTPGKEYTTRRLVYMNPYKGTWYTGIIFSDHNKYTFKEYNSDIKYRKNRFEIKAYFIRPEGQKSIRMGRIEKDTLLQFPTQKIEMDSLVISNYNF